MKKIVFIGIAAALVSTACNHADTTQTTELKSEVTVPETDHHHGTSAIELNNGAKWKVVPEMMQHIRAMEADVIQFTETKQNELQEYIQLGTALQKNIDLLTASCTMEGKGHDELHKWLVPYIQMVDDLNKSKNSVEAKERVNEIKSSFVTLNDFFE